MRTCLTQSSISLTCWSHLPACHSISRVTALTTLGTCFCTRIYLHQFTHTSGMSIWISVSAATSKTMNESTCDPRSCTHLPSIGICACQTSSLDLSGSQRCGTSENQEALGTKCKEQQLFSLFSKHSDDHSGHFCALKTNNATTSSSIVPFLSFRQSLRQTRKRKNERMSLERSSRRSILFVNSAYPA